MSEWGECVAIVFAVASWWVGVAVFRLYSVVFAPCGREVYFIVRNMDFVWGGLHSKQACTYGASIAESCRGTIQQLGKMSRLSQVEVTFKLVRSLCFVQKGLYEVEALTWGGYGVIGFVK